MNDSSIQLRITILNVPDDLSALKLRGWLQQQAQEIQSTAVRNTVVRIKVYLTQKQRLAFTQKKLDALLQAIVEKHEVIQGIELIQVQSMLTAAEMAEAQKDAQADLAAMIKHMEERDLGDRPKPTFH